MILILAGTSWRLHGKQDRSGFDGCAPRYAFLRRAFPPSGPDLFFYSCRRSLGLTMIETIPISQYPRKQSATNQSLLRPGASSCFCLPSPTIGALGQSALPKNAGVTLPLSIAFSKYCLRPVTSIEPISSETTTADMNPELCILSMKRSWTGGWRMYLSNLLRESFPSLLLILYSLSVSVSHKRYTVHLAGMRNGVK